MPTESLNIKNKGKAKLDMLANLGLQNIKVRFIPATMTYDLYLSERKIKIAVLEF